MMSNYAPPSVLLSRILESNMELSATVVMLSLVDQHLLLEVRPV